MRKFLALLPLLLPAAASAGLMYGGVLYKQNQVHTLNGSELRGTLVVQPHGILSRADDPNRSNMGWLFSVTSNRSEGSAEFYAAYSGNDPIANFGLFAWSCTEAWKCKSHWQTEPHAGPAFMFNYPLLDYPQYVASRIDEGGHRTHAMQFVLRTAIVGQGVGAPKWRHSLLLWNKDTLHWDTFWTHDVVRPARDCADSTCGGMAAMMEVHTSPGCSDGSYWQSGVDMSCPMPGLREVGFEDMQVRHDGGVSTFSQWNPITRRGDTDWVIPHPAWYLFHRTANRSFTVGNLANGMLALVPPTGDPKPFPTPAPPRDG